MKALIFGSNGQDGIFLSNLLERKNIEVIGISRSNARIVGSVADFALVESVIKSQLPDFIFHFAANSTTQHAALFDNHSTISTGTLNILEAVRLHSPQTKVFLSGSALQFKNDGVPIDEQTAFEASSAYSVSRMHSIYAARYYRSAFAMKVYVGFFFNHDSELRSEKHVNQKIVATVKRISNGSDEKLEIGNIDVLKEFNYAGDVVQAAWELVNQNQIFEAVIGCGEAHSIKEWAEYCFNKVNMSWKDHLVIKQGFIPEYKILVSNPKLIRQIGWQPQLGFYELADIMMEAL
jgi:GDPmannose 4,6-dehydratase